MPAGSVKKCREIRIRIRGREYYRCIALLSLRGGVKRLSEIIRGMKGSADEEEPELFDGWLYAMPDTLDAIAFLYSDLYLEASNPFHFDHWNEQPHAEAPLRKAECTLYLYTIRVIDVFSSFID